MPFASHTPQPCRQGCAAPHRGGARERGAPDFSIVGLAEGEVKESRDGDRAALQSAHLERIPRTAVALKPGVRGGNSSIEPRVAGEATQ